MLYKLLLNYFRLKLFRLVLSRIIPKKKIGKVGNKDHVLPIGIMGFSLEFLASYFLNPKKKPRQHK